MAVANAFEPVRRPAPPLQIPLTSNIEGGGVGNPFLWKALCQWQQPHMQASASTYAFPLHQVDKHATKKSCKNKLRTYETTSDSSVIRQAEARHKHPTLWRPDHLSSECSVQKNLRKSPESWKPLPAQSPDIKPKLDASIRDNRSKAARTQSAASRGRRKSRDIGEQGCWKTPLTE